MNSLIFYEDRVVKKYSSRKRFETELKMRDLFSETFCIPRILDIDDTQNTVHFERVYGLATHDLISRIKLEEMMALFDRIPKLKGRRVGYSQKSYVLSKITDKNLIDFINELSLEGNDLIHGDFRPHNLLQTTNGIYLLDFELSDYGDREKDMAYWYVGTIYFNQQKGDEFLDFMKKQLDYKRFLFYCLYYSLTAAENPLSNRTGLERLKLEICEEIENIN